MARLPDAQALGERPVPQPRGGIPSISNAGVAEGTQAQASTKGVTEFADQLAQAGERVMARDDDIKLMQSVRGFREKADTLAREFLSTGNIADPDSTRKFNAQVDTLRQETLGAFTGREPARIKLDSHTGDLQFKYLSHVAGESTKAQQKLVLDEVKLQRNEVAGRLLANNDLGGAILEFDNFVDARVLLNDDVKASLKSDARGEFTEQQISNLLIQQRKEEALSLFQAGARDMNESRRDRVVSRFDAASKTTRLLTQQEKRVMGLPSDVVAEQKRDGSTHIVYNPEKDVKIRDKKIVDLAGNLLKLNPDWTPEQAEDEATGFVDGQISVEINPVTGKVLKLDKRSGGVTELPVSAEAGAEPVGGEPGLYALAAKSGSDVAGVVGFAKEVFGKTAGQVSDTFVPEEAIGIRQEFKSVHNLFIRAFALNKRYPVTEVKRLEEETNVKPQAYNSRKAFLSELRSIDKSLRIMLANEESTARDPNIAPQARSDSAQAVRDIRNFLARLNVPQTSAALPAGVPLGAVLVGTSKSGKKVYSVPGTNKRYEAD